MSLLPLARVDPESVRAHAYASAAHSGNAATVAAVAAALGGAPPVPMGEPVGADGETPADPSDEPDVPGGASG
eukprot:6967894-Prymnesium_polylepis.1